MRFTQILIVTALFCLPSFAQDFDVLTVLRNEGMDAFADELAQNPTLLNDIRSRDDNTIWAPFDCQRCNTGSGSGYSLHPRQNTESDTSAQCSHLPPPTSQSNRRIRKRQTPNLPPTNLEIIYTFYSDTSRMNLGGDSSSPWNIEPLRFVKNYGTPTGAGGSPPYEVTTGFGRIVRTCRGPIKFNRGVIYAAEGSFSLPGSFTETFQEITTAQRFYQAVASSDAYPLYQNNARATIFAPVDTSLPENAVIDPRDYIMTNSLLFTPDLFPGRTYTTASGRSITITFGPDGAKTVNGRRIVQHDVPTTNGVVHYIDGPLF